jgi:TonB family protein
MDNSEKLIKKPVYPGGRTAMDAFIKANLNYPEKALEAKKEGTVAVVLDIDGRGKVIRGRVKSGLGFGLDEEAIRVCSLLQFRVAKNHRKRITFHRTINIHFRLPKAKKVKKTPLNPSMTSSNSSSTYHLPMNIAYNYKKRT